MVVSAGKKADLQRVDMLSSLREISMHKSFIFVVFIDYRFFYVNRPSTQSGRPLSGVVRPGTQGGRPGTMDQALRTPRTAHTARPVSAASGILVIVLIL